MIVDGRATGLVFSRGGELMRAGAEVQPLLTEAGERMVSRATFAALTGRR